MDTNTILVIMGSCGTVLCGAVAKLWVSHSKELADCKEDRTNLTLKTDGLHEKVRALSESVGEMRGRLGMTTERE
jgi:hypothetical protein